MWRPTAGCIATAPLAVLHGGKRLTIAGIFTFCNLDPYRVCLTDEFQADLRPPMSYLRSDHYDNQRGEVEKADGPVDHSLWDGSTETLECVVLGEN